MNGKASEYFYLAKERERLNTTFVHFKLKSTFPPEATWHNHKEKGI